MSSFETNYMVTLLVYPPLQPFLGFLSLGPGLLTLQLTLDAAPPLIYAEDDTSYDAHAEDAHQEHIAADDKDFGRYYKVIDMANFVAKSDLRRRITLINFITVDESVAVDDPGCLC